MAEPFNAEQYRQQMSGQPVQGQPMPAYGQPQPYQPPQMQHLQMPQTHMQQTQMHQTQAQPRPHQPQEWTPQHHQPQHPHMMQPQTHVHHMPAAPVYAPPPGAGVDVDDEAPKTSRFKRKRAAKVKTPKVKKNKAEGSAALHTSKTSPAIIFMFGMATGIVAFLAGNMMMSNYLTDNSAKTFREIERQNAQAQQPVLPKSAQNAESEAKPLTP